MGRGRGLTASAPTDPTAGRTPPRRPGRPPRTSLDALVDAAIDIGLDTFTIPAVAERVEVGESTIYGYVAGRAELYAAAATTIVASLDVDSDAPTWADYVDTIAERAVALARRHPGLRDYVLWGPYEPSTIAAFEALVARVHAYRPELPDAIAWVLASRPVVQSLTYLGDPVLEPLAPWLRRALLTGLEAQLAAGDLPAVAPVAWQERLARR